MLGRGPPPRVAGMTGEEPHHAGVKPATPIGPELASMPPAPLLGVDREKIGVGGNGGADLTSGEVIRPIQPRLESLEIDHFSIARGNNAPSICPLAAAVYPGSIGGNAG